MGCRQLPEWDSPDGDVVVAVVGWVAGGNVPCENLLKREDFPAPFAPRTNTRSSPDGGWSSFSWGCLRFWEESWIVACGGGGGLLLGSLGLVAVASSSEEGASCQRRTALRYLASSAVQTKEATILVK